MSLKAWTKIANDKKLLEDQTKNINNQILANKISNELGQIGYEKLLKPVTGRLDSLNTSIQQIPTQMAIEEEPTPNFLPPPPIDSEGEPLSDQEEDEYLPLPDRDQEEDEYLPLPDRDQDSPLSEEKETPERKKWDLGSLDRKN